MVATEPESSKSMSPWWWVLLLVPIPFQLFPWYVWLALAVGIVTFLVFTDRSK